MCTSPHSKTEELKMYLPSVGSFLTGLFSFPLLQPQIGSSYFLPCSESRVLSSHHCKHRVFLVTFSFFFFSFFPSFKFPRSVNSGTILGSRIISFTYKVERVCDEVVVFCTFFTARLVSDPILVFWAQWTLGSSSGEQEAN